MTACFGIVSPDNIIDVDPIKLNENSTDGETLADSAASTSVALTPATTVATQDTPRPGKRKANVLDEDDPVLTVDNGGLDRQ